MIIHYLQFEYSEKYQDSTFEYRHVILTKDIAKTLPKNRTLTEQVSRFLMNIYIISLLSLYIYNTYTYSKFNSNTIILLLLILINRNGEI